MKIIINADDLGISQKVNQSIIQMHRKGIVSSTSLMASGPNFKEAVELLSNHPNLGIGVHLCLDGHFNIASDYATLFDPVNNSFFEKKEVIKRIRNSSFDRDEIFREFCLQVEKILDHGIRVSHLDTHHNLHLYFPVLSQVIRVARKYGILYIRSQRLHSCLHKSYLNTLYRNIHHIYLNLRLHSTQRYYDPSIQNSSTWEFNLSRLERELSSNKGVMEIMLHPLGNDDPETIFFSSPEVWHLLSRHTIINYHQLN